MKHFIIIVEEITNDLKKNSIILYHASHDSQEEAKTYLMASLRENQLYATYTILASRELNIKDKGRGFSQLWHHVF